MEKVTNDQTASTQDGELVELGKFRKVDGGWQGYVRGSDGHPTLIIISNSPETDTHRAIVPINKRAK